MSQHVIAMTGATSGVEIMAHYLLARLLLPSITDKGHLVITTSDTRDPAINPLAPTELDTQALAHPGKGRFGSSMRAYSSSKLCNLLTAQSFAALDETRARGISVIAYNPGFTGGTSRGRHHPLTVRALMTAARPLIRLLGNVRPEYHMGTPERAGEALTEVALGTVTLPPGGLYASVVKRELTFPEPSDLAKSTEAGDRLWRDSAAMVGIR